MRHETEDWDAEWQNPDFNLSPPPEKNPGKYSKEVMAKTAPKKKEPTVEPKVEPKEEEVSPFWEPRTRGHGTRSQSA